MRVFQGPGKAATLLIALFLVSFGAWAQSTSIQTFSQEATLPFANIGVTGPINIPANVVQSISGGALEVRQTVEFLPQTNRMRIRHFLVPRGTANPTPANAQMTPVEDYLVTIDQVLRLQDSLVFIGRVDQRNVDSPFGNFQNRTVIYSVGYQSGTPTRFAGSTLTIPGLMSTYIPSSTGTLAFTTGGGGGTGDVVTADAGPDITTLNTDVTLDATLSKDPAGGNLTYNWRVVSGSASLTGANTARPRVQLSSGFGEYIFEVTVTDSRGQTATDRVRVFYAGLQL